MKIYPKTIFIIAGVLLFSLNTCLSCPDLCWLGARRAKETSQLTESLRRTLTGIGYENEAEVIIAKIRKIFPGLEKLRGLFPEDRISALASMIRQNITDYEEETFELPQVLDTGKSDCLGFSQLFYVLGKALNLSLEIIRVYPRHCAVLISLNRGCIILDLTGDIYYQSDFFDWEENYEQDAGVWILKEESQLPASYEIIQRINEDGIIAARVNNYGFAKAKSGLYEEAIAYYDKAIKLDSYADIFYYNRGNANRELGRYREALDDYDRAAKINPYDSYALNNRAIIKDKLGMYDEAAEDFDMAIALNLDFAEARFNRGIFRYYKLGKEDDGIEDIKRALELKPDLSNRVPPSIKEILLKTQ